MSITFSSSQQQQQQPITITNNNNNNSILTGTTSLTKSKPSSSKPTLKLRSQPNNNRSLLLARCDSPTAWLIYYFAFNLGLTIFNKRVLISFPFPWTLTAIHTLAGTIGSQLAHAQGLFSAARLSRNHNIILIAFSILYTVNIAVSNLSLHLVTVPFHQVVRATTPLFTIILSIIYFNKSYPFETYLSLFIVVLGVGLSTYGDYGWTLPGLLLTLLGTILASFKTVVTNVIQVGRLRLNPLDLLMRMSPLAFIQCLLYAYLTGEIESVHHFAHQQHFDRRKVFALIINGIIAFGLNVVSFTANKKTSALTMTVAANVKQVLTILSAILIFKLVITPMNLLGILITLIGGAYYAKIELERKYSNKKADDVLIIPSHTYHPLQDRMNHQAEAEDEEDNQNSYHHHHDHHDKKKLMDQEEAPGQDDRDGLSSSGSLDKINFSSAHPLQINTLLSKQRAFNLSGSARELEEGALPSTTDPPILNIISPR
ncbi:UAA transporter [Puccinia graminis f. sp. tritici]|uniref:UAA transporter n=1 Tax=Puccinia graminis f. sp. tritici TaxID=56615 RepID=A0A5B0P1J4_PUCGR|nr:UAA transporter [Puccinia graminis f. sp. tritici]KAA1128952.1 UAA transporter [Puccinia graminis f. sp. tritici]